MTWHNNEYREDSKHFEPVTRILNTRRHNTNGHEEPPPQQFNPKSPATYRAMLEVPYTVLWYKIIPKLNTDI